MSLSSLFFAPYLPTPPLILGVGLGAKVTGMPIYNLSASHEKPLYRNKRQELFCIWKRKDKEEGGGIFTVQSLQSALIKKQALQY